MWGPNLRVASLVWRKELDQIDSSPNESEVRNRSEKTRLLAERARANERSWSRRTPLVLVSQGCRNQTPHAGPLKQQEFMASQLWRLEVWSQDVIRVGSSEGCEGQSVPGFSPSIWSPEAVHRLVDDILWVSPHPLFLRVAFPLSTFSFFIVDYNTPSRARFNLLTFAETLFPDKVAFWYGG